MPLVSKYESYTHHIEYWFRSMKEWSIFSFDNRCKQCDSSIVSFLDILSVIMYGNVDSPRLIILNAGETKGCSFGFESCISIYTRQVSSELL
jgi:hypothetical protein